MISGLVSVIVTTKNEEEVIADLLKSIRNQNYKKIETILVDNNSTDRTTKIAKKFKAKTFNFGPERSAQRNLGANSSRGKYLLFLDADMKLSKNVILEAVRLCQNDKEIAAVVIPERSIYKTFWEEVKAFERSFYNAQGDKTTDAARFYLRKVFKKAGGYDETITGPEDWDLPETVTELGFKTGRIKSVIYHKERLNSPISAAKKKYYYGLGAHKYMSKHNIPAISPKTIYFLRPVFYRSWKKMVFNPLLTLAMFYMLGLELIAGGAGYMLGRLKNK